MGVISFILDYVDATTVGLGVIVYLLVLWIQRPRDLPPGPRGLPILGVIPFILGQKFDELPRFFSKKFGSVFRYSMGSMETIFFGDYEATKASFIKQGDNFAGKPQEIGWKVRETDTGIGYMESDAWKTHRRFILSTFRDFGMGKLSLEPKITEEVHCFLDALKRENGQPFDLSKLLGISVANVICTMEFGNRFDYDHPEFCELRNIMSEGEKFKKIITIRLLFPWMKYIPFMEYFCGWNEMLDLNAKFMDFFKKKIAEHRNVYEEGSRKDFIDAFITEKNNAVKKIGSDENYTDEVLEGTLGFLFFAGAETIVGTMKWALAILMTHPHVMEKVRKEIDDVIGMERNPSISDRTNMTYTEAFLQEVHRFASLLPSVIHCNLETTTINGYRIPKRSLVGCPLFSIHQDPTLWEDPELFKPERFLDDKGNLQKQPEYFLAFGVGKRNCIGESLARMELFLYITSLLQRFEFRIPDGETISSSETRMTFIREPKPFKLCYIPRTA